MQIIHWFTGNKKSESEETMILLDAIFVRTLSCKMIKSCMYFVCCMSGVSWNFSCASLALYFGASIEN